MLIQQSETARDCFHDHVPKIIPAQQQKILDVVVEGCDYTIGELAWWTGMDKSAISGRRFTMLREGLLEYGAERLCSVSGIRCQTVRKPTLMQLEFSSARGFSYD